MADHYEFPYPYPHPYPSHTPTPMAFLSRALGRPENERPFIMFPVGYPLKGVRVPALKRKALGQVMTIVGEDPAARA